MTIATPCSWCQKPCKSRFIDTCLDFKPNVGALAMHYPDLVEEMERKPVPRVPVVTVKKTGQRIKRVCKTCGAQFWVMPSVLKRRYNGGLYCSRPCHNNAMRRHE